GHEFLRRGQIVRHVVDEGDGPFRLAAQAADGGALGHFRRQERVAQAELVEMPAADIAMAVRHGSEKDHFGILRYGLDRFRSAIRDGLPVRLAVEEARKKLADVVTLGLGAAVEMKHVTVETEIAKLEPVSLP